MSPDASYQVLSQMAFLVHEKKWRPSWISDRNDFSYFDLHDTPMLPTKFRVNWPFDSGEEAKNHGFPIGTILAIFDVQVTPMLPTKFQLALCFKRRSEKYISRWPSWRPSWISDRNDFTYF